MELKEVKKRGRKPKQKYIVNDNPIFDNKNDKQIIINIKNVPKDIKDFNTPDSYEPGALYYIYDSDKNIIENKFCMNCKTSIKNNYTSLPLKYINNIFHLYGKFCNYECCKKYAMNNYKYNKYEIYSYINLILSMNDENIKIKIIMNPGIDTTQKKIYSNKNLKLYRSKKEKNNILSIIMNQ